MKLASRQHGVITRQQLLADGWTSRQVDHALRTGRLLLLHPGTYATPGSPATWRRAADITTIDSIPVTKPVRTIIDAASVLDHRSLERLLDTAYGRRLISGSYVYRRLERLGRQGRPGAGVLAAMLTARPEATTVFERRLFRLLQTAGLPLPIPQYEVRLRGDRSRFIDYGYPQFFLGLEANSFEFHAGALAWARDDTRNAELIALGWSIFPVTWYDLDEPGSKLELIEQSLRTRGWEGDPHEMWVSSPRSA